jgi:hypothetical protein
VASKKTGSKKVAVSLVDFVRLQKKVNCRVCKLPVEIRGQLGRVATDRKIPREVQLDWIKTATGVKITNDELTAHNNGRHDAP